MSSWNSKRGRVRLMGCWKSSFVGIFIMAIKG